MSYKDHTTVRVRVCVCVCVFERECVRAHLGEAEVEVPLQRAPLRGDDLVEDRGQDDRHGDPEHHQQPPGNAALGVEAVVLRFRVLLP